MLQLRRTTPALLALLLAPLAAYAGDAADWLLRMSQAAKAANYQGVVIYRGDDVFDTFRVTHRFKDGVERERVQSLSGEPRDILKQDGRTICLLPNARRMTAEHPTPQGLFPGLTSEKVALLSKIYQFDDLGTERRDFRRRLVVSREAHNLMAVIDQLACQLLANEPARAGHENAHGYASRFARKHYILRAEQAEKP